MNKNMKRYYEEAYDLLELQDNVFDIFLNSKLGSLSVDEITKDLLKIAKTTKLFLAKHENTNGKIDTLKVSIAYNMAILISYVLAYIIKMRGSNIDNLKDINQETEQIYRNNTKEQIFQDICKLSQTNIELLKNFIDVISSIDTVKG